ncbi:hypothetical protein F5Y18DRAFT_337429 [Xylariaceae sp. FL1019]|nr:hypothetical protein F5Y18DRAFT_337429 [Xylariaceae sp. FL1019]
MTSKFQRQASTPEPGVWGSELVKVRANGGKKDFHIHARLLAHFSKYFRTALNSNFKEAETRDFTLTEHCDDAVLTMFTAWVYQRHTAHEKIIKASAATDANVPTSSVYVKSWLFGDYIGAPEFQNALMHEIHEKRHKIWSGNVTRKLWCRAPVDSALDSVFFESFCEDISRATTATQERCFLAAMTEFPSHVAPALTRRLMHKQVTDNWNLKDDAPNKIKMPHKASEWMGLSDFLVNAEHKEEEDINESQEGERIPFDNNTSPASRSASDPEERN